MSKECVRIIPNKFYLNDSGLSIHTKNENLQFYINYYLLSDYNQQYIYEYCTSGSIQCNINMPLFKNLQIPIPKSEDKITEWVNKISKPYDEKNNKQNKIKELEEYVQNKIKDITDNEECDEVELGSIAKINYGKRITKNKDEGNEYLAYGGGNLMSYKVNTYNRDGITYKVSRDGLSKHNCITKIYGKIFLNDTALTLDTLDVNIVTNYYIGEILLNQKKYIYDNCTHGTAQKHININNLLKIKIKIPKDKKLIQDLEPTFQEIEKLNDELKEAEILYKQFIKELAEEAIPSTATLTEENIKNNTETDSKTSSVKSSVSSSSSVKELKEQCKSLGIKGYSKCKKAELIKLLEDHK